MFYFKLYATFPGQWFGLNWSIIIHRFTQMIIFTNHHPFDMSVPCWSLSLTPTTCQAISLPFDLLLIFHSFTLTPSMAKPFNNNSNCMATSSEVSNCPPSGLASSTCWFLSYKLSYMSQQEYPTSCYLYAGIVLGLESLLKSGSTLACCCLAYDGCHQGCSDL